MHWKNEKSPASNCTVPLANLFIYTSSIFKGPAEKELEKWEDLGLQQHCKAERKLGMLQCTWTSFHHWQHVSSDGSKKKKRKKKGKKEEERTGWAMYDHLYKVYEKDENGTTRYTLLGSLASVPWFSTTIKIWTWQCKLEAARLTLVYPHNTQYDGADFMLLASIELCARYPIWWCKLHATRLNLVMCTIPNMMVQTSCYSPQSSYVHDTQYDGADFMLLASN